MKNIDFNCVNEHLVKCYYEDSDFDDVFVNIMVKIDQN